MDDNLRMIELSEKFAIMGDALIKEGNEKDEKSIILVGATLTYFSGIMLSEYDLIKFSEVLGMFSAKKILDNLMTNKDFELDKYLPIERIEMDELFHGIKETAKKKKKDKKKGGKNGKKK